MYKNIDEIIDKVKEDLKGFNSPAQFMSDKYYIKLEAKADYANNVLCFLLELKEYLDKNK